MAGFYKSFDVEYAHNSTAIEGNTLTLIQTKAILEDCISVDGKTLRKIYEVANHAKAFAFVKKCVRERKKLDESTVKDIHALLMENVLIGGIYRNVEVRIVGAGFHPPMIEEMFQQIRNFFAFLPDRTDLNPFIEMIGKLEESRLDEYLSIIHSPIGSAIVIGADDNFQK